MSAAHTSTAVRKSRTGRTGKVTTTIEITYPDGTTETIGGKRAERAAAVIVIEGALYDYTQRDPEDDRYALCTGWAYGQGGARANVSAAQSAADAYLRSRHIRQAVAIPVT